MNLERGCEQETACKHPASGSSIFSLPEAFSIEFSKSEIYSFRDRIIKHYKDEVC